MNHAHAVATRPKRPQPAWEVAELFPPQGMWTEEEYLDLDTNHLVEFTNGYLEVLPMPTTSHQEIALWLYRMLLAFVQPRRLGRVLAAPIRVRLGPNAYREPDVVFMSAKNASRVGEDYWEAADLVMEVVSEKGRLRDIQQKRREYAAAGIPEYWIVDPKAGRITVLRLAGKRYMVHGEFDRGEAATSALLGGFSVDVAAALTAK